MGSQVSAKTNDKEQQLKKASKMAMVRALLPIVGLVVIFLLFNVLTDFRMMGNMSLAFSQVYVTMIAAMGVFFILRWAAWTFLRDLSLELLQSLYVFFQNMELQLQFLVVLHQVRSSVRSTDSSMYTVRSNHSLLQFVPCSYSVDLSNI